MLAHSSARTIAPAVYPNLHCDVVRDFAAVIPLGRILNALIVLPAKVYRTRHDLVAAAKAKPGLSTLRRPVPGP
jgi:tripartite-type tricarboxylate transporter receptor subunit TctC